jgi:hypothetical protein
VSGSPQNNGAAPEPLYSTRFKIVAATLVTLVVIGLVVAVKKVDSTSDTAAGNSSSVERLIPVRGSQLVQQGTVGIDLKSGWDGALVINATEVPDKDLHRAPSLNELTFTPGPKKVMEALPTGKVCATARVWKLETGPRQSSLVTWCFEVI